MPVETHPLTPELDSENEGRRDRGARSGDDVTPSVEQVKDSAKELADEVREQAAGAAGWLKEESVEILAQQKERAALKVRDLSGAMDEAARGLEDKGEAKLAECAHDIGQRLRSVSAYLQDHELAAILADAQRIARARPEVFLGGMFVAGLALARFLKASTPEGERRHAAPLGESYAPGERGETSHASTSSLRF